ncbi:sodium-coupled neutral amino acid transporter 5-like [Paramormyrops kingsleyae]|uniref:sodium-coupled neutral amino acid transporter 5-like n=1 Tax=Paramormyrops kingsleyae TaxID=1676925 RepID=UPI003B9736D6
MELEKRSNGIHYPEHVTTETRCTDEDGTVLPRFHDAEATPEEREEFLPHMPDEQNQSHFTDFVGKTSLGMSIFNLSNAIMGSGVLGLAYAMANTGIILFVILLTSIATLSAYSIHLLLRSADIVGIRAYEQLSNQAIGAWGKVLEVCVISIHNIGAICSYLFIVKSELPLVIGTFLGTPSNSGEWYLKGDYLIIIASLIIILPLALMRQLGYLGYTSGLSLTCMVFFLISVIYKKFNVGCPLEDHNLTQPLTAMVNSTSDDDVCEAKLITFNSRTAYAIPIVSFAFVCQPVVLPIYTELWKPTKKRMQRVANISVLAMFLMYLLTAVFGYLTFYDKVESELLYTYKGDSADHLILCVRLAVLMAVTLTVPVIIFPIRRALLQLFFDAKPFNWVRHISVTFGLLVFVNILVILVPNIKDIFGVIGATSAPTLIFILPGIFYIRIVPENLEPLNSRPKIQAACFASVGFLLMVISISLIIMDWASGGQ